MPTMFKIRAIPLSNEEPLSKDIWHLLEMHETYISMRIDGEYMTDQCDEEGNFDTALPRRRRYQYAALTSPKEHVVSIDLTYVDMTERYDMFYWMVQVGRAHAFQDIKLFFETKSEAEVIFHKLMEWKYGKAE